MHEGLGADGCKRDLGLMDARGTGADGKRTTDNTHMVVTDILKGASSWRRESHIPLTANLVAEYRPARQRKHQQALMSTLQGMRMETNKQEIVYHS